MNLKTSPSASIHCAFLRKTLFLKLIVARKKNLSAIYTIVESANSNEMVQIGRILCALDYEMEWRFSGFWKNFFLKKFLWNNNEDDDNNNPIVNYRNKNV